MANEEINALRRLMDSVNRLSASNSASIGKLTTEQVAQRQELLIVKAVAERAINLCDNLASRLAALETRISKGQS